MISSFLFFHKVYHKFKYFNFFGKNMMGGSIAATGILGLLIIFLIIIFYITIFFGVYVFFSLIPYFISRVRGGKYSILLMKLGLLFGWSGVIWLGLIILSFLIEKGEETEEDKKLSFDNIGNMLKSI